MIKELHVIEIGPKESFSENFFLASKSNETIQKNFKMCKKIENLNKSIIIDHNFPKTSYVYFCPQSFDSIFFSHLIRYKSAFVNFFF